MSSSIISLFFFVSKMDNFHFWIFDIFSEKIGKEKKHELLLDIAPGLDIPKELILNFLSKKE